MRIAALCLAALIALTACGNDANNQPDGEQLDEQPPQAGLSLKPAPAAPVAADPATTDPAHQEALMTPPANLVRCPEQRPQMCTMEYMPVIGWQEDGATQEYANKCGACADGAVVGYLPAPPPENAEAAH